MEEGTIGVLCPVPMKRLPDNAAMPDQRIAPCVFFTILIASCGEGEGEPVAMPEQDPIVQQALNDRLMVDPDLAFQNEGNAALTIGFDHSLPPIDAGPDTLATIREEARISLLEGGAIPALPEAVENDSVVSLARASSAQERAALLPATRNCSRSLAYSAIWAARLPDFAQIVPRGAVVDAAGADQNGCRLRVVTYRTPLSPDEALQFHFTLAERAGLKPRHLRIKDGEQVLQGAKRSASVAIHTRPALGGLTEVDIVSIERS